MTLTPSNSISRRRFLATTGIALGACSLPARLFAEEDHLVADAFRIAPTVPIAVRPLRRNVVALLGPGGNIAVLTGPDGKLLVDSEIVTARPNVASALAKINSDPIKQLINTHWHFDHAGGNLWVHEAGATILAQANTKKHLSQDTRVEGWHYTFPAMAAGALPSVVFDDTHTLHVNNSTLVMNHYPPAHTDSDIDVHFVEADILHTGDTFWNRNYPFIDYSTGGSIDGQIRAAEANLAKVTNSTVVIPGHGEVCGKPDLQLFRDVLAGIREKVAALKKQGKTLDEVIAAKPSASTDAEWGQSFMNPARFLALVYQGV